MRAVPLFAALLSMAACTAPQPSRVDETNPTVTYKYYGDLYGSQFDEVSARADDYCAQQFGKQSHLQNADDNGDENFAVFECI